MCPPPPPPVGGSGGGPTTLAAPTPSYSASYEQFMAQQSHAGQLQQQQMQAAAAQVWSLIQLFWLFRIRDQGKKDIFTNSQSRFVSVVVLGPPCLSWHTWHCPCFSVVTQAMHNQCWRPPFCELCMKAEASTLILSYSSTILVAGRNKMEQKSPWWEVIDLPSRQINEFLPIKPTS